MDGEARETGNGKRETGNWKTEINSQKNPFARRSLKSMIKIFPLHSNDFDVCKITDYTVLVLLTIHHLNQASCRRHHENIKKVE